MSINLHLYPANIVSESRFFRTVTSLSENFKDLEIHVCGIWKEGLAEKEITSNGIVINRFKILKRGIKGTQSFYFYQDFKKSVLEKYTSEKINIIHSHSLFDLSIGAELKKKNPGIKLIYDAHELETEKNRIKGFQKYLRKIKEKKFIKKADEILVVNDSIAQWYINKYNVSNVTVIKNVVNISKSNKLQEPDYLRNRFKIKSEEIIFIYIGSLQKGRGIELLLDVFSSSCHQLVIMGFGELENRVIKKTESAKNIHFHPAVSREDLIPITSTADVGLVLIENTCLSYYLCLPNKLYEYLYAGIPIISSNFPEMSSLINKYNAGWTTSVDSKSVSELIKNLSPEEIKKKKQTLRSVEIEKWETEEKKLIELYRNNLFRNS